MMADKIALGFKNFSVANPVQHDKLLLDNVSGFAEKGSVTAVMGASGSGKSLLLQAVTARLQDMKLSGDVFMNSEKINPKSKLNPVAYVPQDDSLIGDLKAREVVLNTALLKRNEPRDKLNRDVIELLGNLGLGHVTETIIGTFVFRGLSGGQKKRVEVATELIATPSILVLDEPTSGLDSSVALEVLSRIRHVVKSSKGRVSVILSIHQPNSKMLEMFDHLLLLEKGRSIFFGTLPQAKAHFASIGCEIPHNVTPTDYFLQISDTNFSFGESKLDFPKVFKESSYYRELSTLLDEHEAHCKEVQSGIKKLSGADKRASGNIVLENTVPFWYQVYILVCREYTLAYKDPFLYYFQLILCLMFAFLIGAVFWDLPFVVDGNFGRVSGALLWVVLPLCWVHAFKVYYLNSSTKRAEHEMLNAKYNPAAVLLSDTISTATLTSMFLSTVPIIMFMVGFPKESVPMALLCGWVVLQVAEAMIAVVTKLSSSPTTGMIFAQICLVNLEVFGGGVFIPWPDCPQYWVWLQEITVFCQGSRLMMMTVYNHLKLTCTLNSSNECVEPGTGNVYTCVSYSGNTCEVEAREVLHATQGVGEHEDLWPYFLALAALYVFLKSLVAFLTFFPINRVKYVVLNYFAQRFPSTTSSDDETTGRAVTPSKSGGKGGKDDYSKVSSAKGAVPDEVSKPASSGTDTLSWKNFSVVLPKSGKRLVDNVDGFVKSGRICGLMGPSGAGKTTLLNGLANRAPYADLEGSVCFVDRLMTPKDLTYVPQFDEVNDAMTIREHLVLVGRLMCDDEEDVQRRVGEILDVLGLTERQDVRVAKLTGGEIKRVSIGVGLISMPNVLFLDEPTTGLDSTAAYSIVQYLAKVAKSMDIAVIMTIHQPSAMVFDMMDDLFLLEMGHLVYGGSIKDAADYFASIGLDNPENINPADYYLDLIQNEPTHDVLQTAKNALSAQGVEAASLTTWGEIFKLSNFGKKYFKDLDDAKAHAASKRKAVTAPTMLKQFMIMFVHFTQYFLADPGYFIHVCYSLLVIAIFNSTMFLQLETETSNISIYTGALFTTAVAVMLSAVSSTALYARDRREAVDRIKNGYYHPGIYVWSQFLVSLLYKLFATVIFASVFHWAVNLNPTIECFFYDILITWGHLVLMDSALMVFIETLKNAFLCTTCGMIFLGSNMLFAGFFRPQADIPASISWVCYVVPMYWSFKGFAWQVFVTQDFDVTGMSNVELSGRQILDSYFSLRDVNSWAMFGILMAYVVGFRIVQHFLLAYQTSSRRSLFSFSFLQGFDKDCECGMKGESPYEETSTDDKDLAVTGGDHDQLQANEAAAEKSGQLELAEVSRSEQEQV